MEGIIVWKDEEEPLALTLFFPPETRMETVFPTGSLQKRIASQAMVSLILLGDRVKCKESEYNLLLHSPAASVSVLKGASTVADAPLISTPASGPTVEISHAIRASLLLLPAPLYFSMKVGRSVKVSKSRKNLQLLQVILLQQIPCSCSGKIDALSVDVE